MNNKSNHTIEGSNPPFKWGRGDLLEIKLLIRC